MALLCPRCGSHRIIFLSTTNGTAIGSTDQRYLCKDCGYRGSFILEPESNKGRESHKDLVVKDLKKIKKELGL